ncbi:MAG: hypothetical protein R2754_05150 [Microthrixaceae bacterium]
MTASGDLTVGEVLSLLQEDFPEATLGRLREFEDLSLVSPELGPSGHRRYPPEALDRLRWVLTRMRDGFDPADLLGDDGELAVPEPNGANSARSQGEDGPVTGSSAVVRKRRSKEPDAGASAEPTLFDAPGDTRQEAAGAATPERKSDQTVVQPVPTLSGPGASRSEDTAARGAVEQPSTEAQPKRRQPEPPPEPPSSSSKPAASESNPPEPKQPAQEAANQAATEEPSATSANDLHEERQARVAAVSALQEAPQAEPQPRPRPSRTRDLPSATEASELLARSDFLAEVGLEEEALGEMERFGVISPVIIGGTSSYDQSAVRVGGLVASLLELGYEPRHLRMFRLAAEREVDLLRQMALPLLKQRNPVGREQARERLRRAASLGGELHGALVAEGIAELVDHSGADAGPAEGQR